MSHDHHDVDEDEERADDERGDLETTSHERALPLSAENLRGAAEAGLDVRFTTPVTDHAASDAAGTAVLGEQYRQWNAAFDAGYAAALGKPLITLHPPAHDHALKEVDRALAVARDPEQVVGILRYAFATN
jgi:hypothetical protein